MKIINAWRLKTLFQKPCFISIAAFTLAEVLIVIGIIGVIAEMTIPTLANSVTTASITSGFLKDYSVLQQASREIINDSNGNITNAFPTAQDLSDAISAKLKISKKCADQASNSYCWPDPTTIRTLSGADFTGNYDDNGPSFILVDGTVIKIYNNAWYSPDCSVFPRTLGGKVEGMCAVIHMDINGVKPPNQLGRDIFEMDFYSSSGIIPNGTQGSIDDYTAWDSCDPTYTGADSGCGCAARLLNDHGIKY